MYYPIVNNQKDKLTFWRPTNMELVIRTELADPAQIFPAIRRAVQSVDSTIPLAEARSMEEIVADSKARLAFTSTLMATAAALALGLAALGLYGIVSYNVNRRTRETASASQSAHIPERLSV